MPVDVVEKHSAGHLSISCILAKVDDFLEGLAVENYKITRQDVAQVYFSPHPYHQAFEEIIDLRQYTRYGKVSGGMLFDDVNGRLILTDIVPSSPAARIPAWRTRLRGAWLRKVGTREVGSSAEVEAAFQQLCLDESANTTLLFSHPAVEHGVTHDGIPQVNLDQLNPRDMMDNARVPTPLPNNSAQIGTVRSGNVLNGSPLA